MSVKASMAGHASASPRSHCSNPKQSPLQSAWGGTAGQDWFSKFYCHFRNISLFNIRIQSTKIHLSESNKVKEFLFLSQSQLYFVCHWTDKSAQTRRVPGAPEQTPWCLSPISDPQEPAGALAAAKAVLPTGRPEWYVELPTHLLHFNFKAFRFLFFFFFILFRQIGKNIYILFSYSRQIMN